MFGQASDSPGDVLGTRIREIAASRLVPPFSPPFGGLIFVEAKGLVLALFADRIAQTDDLGRRAPVGLFRGSAAEG